VGVNGHDRVADHRDDAFTTTQIDAFAMVAAEEVIFNIQLHRISSKNVVRVDFNLREVCQHNVNGFNRSHVLTTTANRATKSSFLRLSIRFARTAAISTVTSLNSRISGSFLFAPAQRISALQQLTITCSFDIFESWSSSGELFPGSMTVDVQDLVLLVEDIMSVHSHALTRYEAAKQLKDYCQYSTNRGLLLQSLRDRFIEALEKMMRDDNEDIVRFAIYAMLNFAQDQVTWSGCVLTGRWSLYTLKNTY
jgi:hypothetical protein